jgi:zinc protease
MKRLSSAWLRPGYRLRSAAAAGLVLLGCGGSQEPASAPAATAPAAAAEPGADRSGLPEPGPQPSWAPPSPESWQLGSGVRVLHRTHGNVPLVSLSLVLPRGTETDPPKRAGLTYLMGDLLDEGAGTLGALELNERLQTLATDFAVSTGVDFIILSMNTIAENFAPSIDLLADIVRRPKLDEKEFQRRKAQLVAQAIASEADPHTGRRAALITGLFADGYAGSIPTGTRDSLSAITLGEVKTHFSRTVVGEGATFVVVGGIARETVSRELERAFGDWAGKARADARDLGPEPAGGKLYFVDYPGAAQSVIGVARRAPGADADDLFAATVFNRSFGDAFTSRVNLNLREDKGYTYGASSVFQRFEKAGLFGVFSDVRTDVTRESLDEILRELDQLCTTKPLTAEERDAAVSGLLLGYPSTFESIGLVASRFAQLPIYGRPLDWYERWPDRISAITLQQANETGRRYCDRSKFVLAVAGDKAKVAPKLEGLGFEWVELDARGQRR